MVMDTEFLKSLCTPLYVHAKVPVLLMMNTTGAPAPILQMVVCADAREADRIFSQWAQLKARQGRAIGGACTVRYDGPETITRERARYAAPRREQDATG